MLLIFVKQVGTFRGTFGGGRQDDSKSPRTFGEQGSHPERECERTEHDQIQAEAEHNRQQIEGSRIQFSQGTPKTFSENKGRKEIL